MRKFSVLVALLTFGVVVAMAAPRSKAQMREAARQAISSHRSARHLAPANVQLKVLRSSSQVEVLGSEEGGFAIVAADDLLPAVLGVSTARYSGGTNPNFEWWMEATEAAASQIAKSGAPLQVTKPDPTKYPVDVPTLVTTKWDQMEPYYNLCPAFNSQFNCLTGCVATAMAQVLNYHETPAHGRGQRTIHYRGTPVTADFDNDYYDWANMLDFYNPGQYNQAQADAVALLMRDCGVAANMSYGGPDEGSGAYSQDAASGLREYFGFDDAECLERDYYDEPTWMNIIYRELSENGPLYYGGASWGSGGHAFVFDGYNSEGQVSVNWGWSGDDDGYFLISHLNPAYYDFNMQQDMIVGITSDNHARARNEVVIMLAAGQLQQLLEASGEEGVIGSLTIEGPINQADLDYVRFLAGCDASGQPTEGQLRVLDLTKAKLDDNTLPGEAFKGCATLTRVRLPETIAALGGGAFSGCTSLMELRVTTKSVPQLQGTDVFAGVPFGKAKLYVTNGLKARYLQTPQWKDFGEKNIYQVGTSVKVRNAIRKYGEKNPVFAYTVSGGTIVGAPKMTCDATPKSPAGRYEVHISEGSVENSEAMNFIDGYLVVQKVDARATVKSVERYEGEPNPDFTLTYEGLVAYDKEPEWVEAPVFVTPATIYSKPGEYSVYVKSGTAASYNMAFYPGKIIVKAKPVPSGIDEMTQQDARKTVYNLQGQRVDQQRKGLYIENGKKVVRQ